MPAEPSQAQANPVAVGPGNAVYDEFYYAHYCGDRAYSRDAGWLHFFGSIAQEIVARISPRTVLDAGCAMGMVVEALRDRGVEAYGVDVSEYAIANARQDVRPYCRVGSILDPFPRRYDLIVCIEVLEHLPAREAERAVENFTNFSDDVLFSSTPKDFKETTHFNVQPPEWWAELFARHGFYRDVGFDASFITPWAVRFRRLVGPVARVIGDYERRLWWLDQDNRAQRELGLEQRSRLAEQQAAASALEARVKELEASLAAGGKRSSGEESPDAAPEQWRERVAAAERERDLAECRLQVERIRRAVDAHVPAGATVLVVSGGDDESVELAGRAGWHFPRSPEGWHAGVHPADGAEAAAHLEALRAAGAGWIVFPAHAAWWLESYPQFREHLYANYRPVLDDAETRIFDLRRRGRKRAGADDAGAPRAADAPPPPNPKPPVRTRVHAVTEQLGPRPHSSSYVRLLLPLQHPRLAREFDATWGAEYRPAEVVIVERSWNQDEERAAQLVRRVRSDGARLVFSIDDNLMDLEAAWFTAAHRAVVKLLAAEADGVIVSTEPLAERMRRFNDRVFVVPNALDERLLSDAEPHGAAPSAAGKLTIGYMGTATHDEDLEMVAGALRAVLRRNGDRVEFQLVGAVARDSTLEALDGLPVSILRSGDGVEYPDFVRWMCRTLRWDLAIAPLRDDAFNRCKSDIKFLDYGALGIPGVFSRVPAYENTVHDGETGLLADNTSKSWEENLDRLIGDDALRRSIGAAARRYVLFGRTLRQCAPRWGDAIRSIMGAPPKKSRRVKARSSDARAPARKARTPARAAGGLKTALVVVPDDVNYFYAQAGRRLAEAMRGVGADVEVRTLKAAPQDESFDLCVMVNLYELAFGYGDEAAGYDRLTELADRCGRRVAVAMDCARTQWFAQATELCERVGAETLLDLGLHDQSAAVPRRARGLYRFAFNGLTSRERSQVARWGGATVDRPVPWVFVGHVSAERASLVRRLVNEVDPGGFVYMPQLAPYREKGPHLNESQLQSLLERARLHVWCSHHPHFYMESERFRNAALAGCLPVKVVQTVPDKAPSLPFARLVLREGDLAATLRSMDFVREWERFAHEFLDLPSLEESVAGLLADRRAPRVKARTGKPRPASVA